MGGGRGRGKSGQEKDEKRRMDEEGKHFSAHLWSVAGQGKKRIILLSFFHACELLCMCVLFCRSAASDIYPGLEREV